MDLRQAIDIISEGGAKEIEFVTADIKRNTGGELKVMKNAKPFGSSHDQKSHRTISLIAEGQTRTIHTALILKVNGELVI